MSYYPWEFDEDENLAVIGRIPASINDHFWKLHEGISCRDWFPEDVVFEVVPSRGIKLADSIPNSLNIYIVSERLKSLLEKADADFEFFSVKVRNAKGKLSKSPYFVANLVGAIKCMDSNNSDFDECNMDPGQVMRFRRLVLDTSKIPPEKMIFRLGEMTELLLVAEPLALKIAVDNKCTGVNMTYLEDFGEEFR